MIVCSCNVITDAKIRACLSSEAFPRTPGAVYRDLGCSPNCGRCFATVRSMINEALAEGEGACDMACPSGADHRALAEFALPAE